MIMWEFEPPEGSCHNYIVKADYLELAIEKFITWQNENLESKWPEEIIRDKTNWSNNMSTHIIE